MTGGTDNRRTTKEWSNALVCHDDGVTQPLTTAESTFLAFVYGQTKFNAHI